MPSPILGKLSFRNGLKYEDLAIDFLKNKGLSLLFRRKRTPFGEIDLVMKNKEIVYFIEVKFRKKIYDYENVLTNAQLARQKEAAEWIMNENLDLSNLNWQIDLLIFNKDDKIPLHIENITF